jgi:NAD(P)-dependent dehydrogenase (short-subunit alcohol dehydrogenase family)
MVRQGSGGRLITFASRGTPLGRIAEPAEIAGLAVFLASEHARFITGATINVTGGLLMY